MPIEYPLIDINDCTPVKTDLGQNFLLPISGNEGCSSSAYHMTLKPKESTCSHHLSSAEEISVVISGTGQVQLEGEIHPVREGHCLRIPAGITRKYENKSSDPLKIAGFYLNAKNIDEAGFNKGYGPSKYSLESDMIVHWDNVIQENLNKNEGWLINDFRLPFSKHNNSLTTLFRAQFYPGAVHKKHAHKNCEEIYYLIDGHGLAGAGADRVEIFSGQFHYIPSGVEHWLYNLSQTKPLHVIGIYIGSGNVYETGYTYLGDVTDEDISARTT